MRMSASVPRHTSAPPSPASQISTTPFAPPFAARETPPRLPHTHTPGPSHPTSSQAPSSSPLPPQVIRQALAWEGLHALYPDLVSCFLAHLPQGEAVYVFKHVSKRKSECVCLG